MSGIRSRGRFILQEDGVYRCCGGVADLRAAVRVHIPSRIIFFNISNLEPPGCRLVVLQERKGMSQPQTCDVLTDSGKGRLGWGGGKIRVIWFALVPVIQVQYKMQVC